MKIEWRLWKVYESSRNDSRVIHARGAFVLVQSSAMNSVHIYLHSNAIFSWMHFASFQRAWWPGDVHEAHPDCNEVVRKSLYMKRLRSEREDSCRLLVKEFPSIHNVCIPFGKLKLLRKQKIIPRDCRASFRLSPSHSSFNIVNSFTNLSQTDQRVTSRNIPFSLLVDSRSLFRQTLDRLVFLGFFGWFEEKIWHSAFVVWISRRSLAQNGSVEGVASTDCCITLKIFWF